VDWEVEEDVKGEMSTRGMARVEVGVGSTLLAKEGMVGGCCSDWNCCLARQESEELKSMLEELYYALTSLVSQQGGRKA